MTSTPLRVGLIGFGAIGQQVAVGITDGCAGDAALCAILTRAANASSSTAPMVTDFAQFLASRPRVVLEAASPEAVAAYAEPIVATGAHMVVVSTSALVDGALRSRLEAACRGSGARVFLAAGALGGVDALAAAGVGSLDEVTLRVVEPGDSRQVEFEGRASDAARQLPTRLNVAATAMLAAGRDLHVTLVREPGDHAREIVLAAHGAFGEFSARLQPRPRPDQLSHIVALSLLAALRRMQQPIQVG